MVKRPCPGIDGSQCPVLVTSGRCQVHQEALDRRRGDTSQRGYGREHARLRREWARKVTAGQVDCARCGGPIQPDEPWHLDHADDREGYLGPSHARCNESAAGRKGRR